MGGPIPAASVTVATAVVEAAKAEMEYRPNGDGKTWEPAPEGEQNCSCGVNPAGRGTGSGSTSCLGVMNPSRVESYYDVTVLGPGEVPDPLLFPRPRTSPVLHITPPPSVPGLPSTFPTASRCRASTLSKGLVRPTTDAGGKPMDSRELTRGLFEVHSCKGHKPPPTAYVAVRSRGYWFYIDDRDNASKATLCRPSLWLSRLDFGNQKSPPGLS